MYYEILGGGPPVLLLHGAYMTIDMMGPIVPGLAETRQVIVPELQGHGRTADIDRPLSYEGMADDASGGGGGAGAVRSGGAISPAKPPSGRSSRSRSAAIISATVASTGKARPILVCPALDVHSRSAHRGGSVPGVGPPRSPAPGLSRGAGAWGIHPAGKTPDIASHRPGRIEIRACGGVKRRAGCREDVHPRARGRVGACLAPR
jgi:hypothetical protein